MDSNFIRLGNARLVPQHQLFTSNILVIKGARFGITVSESVVKTSTQTEVELTVDFFTVDDIKSIWNAGFHVAHFKIEPLMMMIGIDVGIQYQIILVFTYLKRKQHSTCYSLICQL